MQGDQPFAAPANKQVSALDLNNKFKKPQKFRDPRFDNAQDIDIKAVKNSYKFVKEIREKQNTQLEDQLKLNENDANVSQTLKNKILRNKQKIGNIKSFELEKKIKAQLKKEEDIAVSKGKPRFYMSDKKKEEVIKAVRFNQRKQGSKGHKFFEKKYEDIDKKKLMRK